MEFNYEKPSGHDILKILLVNPEKYEEVTPLKSVRRNKVYTIKNCRLENITCDDNGAYVNNNSNKKLYYVNICEGGDVDIKIVHKVDDHYVYKERSGRFYDTVIVDPKDIYELQRYYSKNKSIRELRRTIFRVTNILTGTSVPHYCIVYFLSCKPIAVDDCKILKHGNCINSKTSYFRTDKDVLTRQDELLDHRLHPQVIYDMTLEESGGPFSSSSISKEPRNLKQIYNRSSKKKTNSEESRVNITGQLESLIMQQRDPDSMVKTVTITDNAYMTFLYTERQIDNISRFCTKQSDSEVLGVDTTFNLCDLWITDTSYINQRLINPSSGRSPVHLGPLMLHFTKTEQTFGRFALELVSANPNLKNLKFLGVDLEAAIFKGFENIIPGLNRLLCARHLSQRDEVKLGNY